MCWFISRVREGSYSVRHGVAHVLQWWTLRAGLVVVPVVCVGEVGVAVNVPHVGVCVAVLQRRLRGGTVLVVVMPVVVTVAVRVSEPLMLVFMLVAFADMQPYSSGHQ